MSSLNCLVALITPQRIQPLTKKWFAVFLETATWHYTTSSKWINTLCVWRLFSVCLPYFIWCCWHDVKTINEYKPISAFLESNDEILEHDMVVLSVAHVKCQIKLQILYFRQKNSFLKQPLSSFLCKCLNSCLVFWRKRLPFDRRTYRLNKIK